MKRVYLNSFTPLICNKFGVIATKSFQLPKYIDGSCRREPDFENKFPCITSLCRPNFANKLNKEDIVIYVTNKKGIGGRKVIAVMEVVETYVSHRAAADWYNEKNEVIPNNLIVKETLPNPLDRTHRISKMPKNLSDNAILRLWNSCYILRSTENPKVVRCKYLYLELNNPIELNELAFERRLIAQNPPILNDSDWRIIKELINL